MSRTSFEAYARLAGTSHADTTVSGRYLNQRLAERKIPVDVLSKLKLTPSDHFLDIGCGPGSLLIPLSFFVNTTTGIDHPEMVKRVRKRFPDPGINLFGGNFLDLEIISQFSKILIYSVLHTLSNQEELFSFLDKAINLLSPGGLMLIGDLPNKNLKARFLASKQGKTFFSAWKKELEKDKNVDANLAFDNETIEINDDVIASVIGHYNSKDYKCCLKSQPKDLPFGHTRQDILIERLE